jgi:hypothetical protein
MNIQTIYDLGRTREEAVKAAHAHINSLSISDCANTAGKTVHRMELCDGHLLIEFVDNTCIAFYSYGSVIEEDCLGLQEAYNFGVLPDELYQAYIDAHAAKEDAEREHREEHVTRKTLKETIEKLSRDEVIALLREQLDA